MEAKKHALIAQLQSARAELNQALEKISPQAQINPAWKLKHLLDHITGWDVLLASAFREHAHSRIPQRTVRHGIDHYNAQSVQDRQDLSYEQSLVAFHDTREELIRSLQDMPTDRWDLEFPAPWDGTCTVSDVLEILIHHEHEHALQIEELPG